MKCTGVVSLFILLSGISPAPSQRLDVITIWDDLFAGAHWDYLVPDRGVCINMLNDAVRRASSIEVSGNCIILFQGGSCSGRGVRFQDYTYGYDDFNRVGFNDVAASFRVC